MKPIAFSDFKEQFAVELQECSLRMQALPQWIIEGEDRLSYATIIRLVEFCREYHWSKDIQPYIQNGELDSITKSIGADFLYPIHVNTDFEIHYAIEEIRTRAYVLKFSLALPQYERLLAVIHLVSIFYSSIDKKVIMPPQSIIRQLKTLQYKGR